MNRIENDADLQELLNTILVLDNGNDMLVMTNIPMYKQSECRRQHQLPEDEAIIYYRYVSEDKSFALTEERISFYDSSNDSPILFISWSDLCRVEYSPGSGFFSTDYFLFYGTDDVNFLLKIESYDILKFESDYSELFASAITKYAQSREYEVSEDENMVEQINKSYEDEDYLATIQLCDKYLSDYATEENDFAYGNWKKGDAYAAIYHGFDFENSNEDALSENAKNIDLAKEAWKESLKHFDDENSKCYIYERIGKNTSDPLLARPYFIRALQIKDAEDVKKEALELYRRSTDALLRQFNEYKRNYRLEEEYKNSSEDDFKFYEELADSERFTSIKYEDRRFIFFIQDENHIAGCYDESNNINWVFTLDKYPSEIELPNGHPQANTLYLGHPLRSSIYVPFEEAEYMFFIDEVRVFCWICQCLGATEISFRTVKGKDVVQNNSDYKNSNADFNIRITKANGNYDSSGNIQSEKASKSAMEMTQKFRPKKMPYIPNDCEDWINAKSDWKQLVKQRLEGNMLNYTQHISSTEFLHLSSNQKRSLKASFSNFMMKANGSFDINTDNTFIQTEETEWEISVSFISVEEILRSESKDINLGLNDNTNLNDSSETKMNYEEKQYEEEVKFCLDDDGIIDEQERKMLERKRIKLKISEEKAADIEKSLTNCLTIEEMKYKEEVDFCLEEENTINENDRKYLERKRIRLNISEERARQIELLCCSKLTDDEKEYIDLVKDLANNGRISDKSRRILERQRQCLNISVERASELEQNIYN